MNTIEKFYRAPNGNIVFNALPNIGADRSFSCAGFHRYRGNSFPSQTPVAKNKINIWSAFSGMAYPNLAAE